MRLNTNPLKYKYPISVRIAGLSGVLVLVFIFLVFPRFISESEFGAIDQIVIENIDIPQTQQIDNTPPPARPSIPVPTDDEDIADLVAYHLRQAGYLTRVVNRGDEVLPVVRLLHVLK